MIMRPEDAQPKVANLFTESGHMIPKAERVFTASKCAEIARAYASALHASEFNSAEAAINAAKWEAKFKEWENG